MFEKDSKTILIKACVTDADLNFPALHTIKIELTVPKEFPDIDLKPIIESATDWCKSLAEKLSAVLWAHPEGRE